MPKTCNAFNWIVYVVVASFIAWGVWFQVLQKNYLSTSPEITKTPIMKKTVTASPSDEATAVKLPMKPSEGKSADEAMACKLTKYNGNATVRGWYEEGDYYGKKAPLFHVVEEDRYKLPEKIQTWADGTPIESVVLEGVGVQLNKLLLKASAKAPAPVDLVSVNVYCEGLPVATVAAK